MSILWPYENAYEVRYEADMGMNSRRFNEKEIAIEFAKTVGGTVYEIKQVWP